MDNSNILLLLQTFIQIISGSIFVSADLEDYKSNSWKHCTMLYLLYHVVLKYFFPRENVIYHFPETPKH